MNIFLGLKPDVVDVCICSVNRVKIHTTHGLFYDEGVFCGVE